MKTHAHSVIHTNKNEQILSLPISPPVLFIIIIFFFTSKRCSNTSSFFMGPRRLRPTRLRHIKLSPNQTLPIISAHPFSPPFCPSLLLHFRPFAHFRRRPAGDRNFLWVVPFGGLCGGSVLDLGERGWWKIRTWE